MPRTEPRVPVAGLLLLWLLAVVLALSGLGDPPLRDWDEGIVARVALEISRRPWPDNLLPDYWGEPYLNKPPGIHLAIAGLIQLWRLISGAPPQALPPEGVVRLVPALIATTVVPLVGLVQARLRPGDRRSVLASAAIVLTLLPLARHGRLVMLDGALLAAMTLQWWGVLSGGAGERAGRAAALAGGLAAGLATSALLLLKAPAALPLLLGALLLRLLERERPRTWLPPLLLGLVLGLLPGVAWHGWHALARGGGALLMWTSQGFARVGASVEGHAGGPIPPLLEVLEGGWPWLPLWPFGIALAWRQRRRRWGLWSLGLTLLTAALVLPLRTQLPWYSLLLWPPFALVAGPALAWLIEPVAAEAPPGRLLLSAVPRFWALLGALLLLAAGLGATVLVASLRLYSPFLAPAGLGLLVGGLALTGAAPGRRVGAAALVAGFWLALWLLLCSPLWLWELNETWPVPPVAAMVQRHGAKPLALWRQGERPSLDWYLQRHVAAIATGALLPVDGRGDGWLLALENPSVAGPLQPGGEPELLPCRAVDAVGELRLYACRRPPAAGR